MFHTRYFASGRFLGPLPPFSGIAPGRKNSRSRSILIRYFTFRKRSAATFAFVYLLPRHPRKIFAAAFANGQ
ncbi:MAG: hypothetical protein C6W56_08040 [Caldibacillus debilis]|nr:MAG: hypothetical protein C6W56_08040 [Caldibacillus debilis]